MSNKLHFGLVIVCFFLSFIYLLDPRIVKFDMPSFDSQISADEAQSEGVNSDPRLTGNSIIESGNSICDIGDDMRCLLEKLQSFEMSASGDHEVLQKFTLERLDLEKKKWMEMLRKSLSNVVRIQNRISHALGKILK